MRKIALFTLAGVSLLSLLLSGCFLFPPPSPLPPPATEGAVLNLEGVDPHTLDPAVSGEMTSHEYILQIFSGLAKLDDNLAPAPDIAERWEMSDNGLTYTFYLRQDVRFGDGGGSPP
jgi:ABC-type transport system substrate-binding protein